MKSKLEYLKQKNCPTTPSLKLILEPLKLIELTRRFYLWISFGRGAVISLDIGKKAFFLPIEANVLAPLKKMRFLAEMVNTYEPTFVSAQSIAGKFLKPITIPLGIFNAAFLSGICCSGKGPNTLPG